MYFHAIAILPGSRQKTIVNKSEEEMLTSVVLPYVANGTIVIKWGADTRSYQVIDLRVYKTKQSWNKKSGMAFEHFINKSRNVYSTFENKAKRALKRSHRVFIVMPIQGEKFGTQDEQRIYSEFDRRFESIEKMLADFDCVAIRIDKEHPLEDIVNRIKLEIKQAKFVIADLTEQRPSCYFEAGFAEALKKSVIYVASKESVIEPGKATTIHFDIHMNVNFFTNHDQLIQKIRESIDKNKEKLFAESE